MSDTGQTQETEAPLKRGPGRPRKTPVTNHEARPWTHADDIASLEEEILRLRARIAELENSIPDGRHWPPTTRVYDVIGDKTTTIGELRRSRPARLGFILPVIPLPYADGRK